MIHDRNLFISIVLDSIRELTFDNHFSSLNLKNQFIKTLKKNIKFFLVIDDHKFKLNRYQIEINRDRFNSIVTLSEFFMYLNESRKQEQEHKKKKRAQKKNREGK